MNQIGLVEIAGMAVVFSFFAWLILFFQVIRPRLMEWVGTRFNIEVRESAQPVDSGTYEIVGDAPLAKHGALTLIDLVVLLVGTVGVCALMSVPAFLIGDSGLPYRLESVLLGQGVSIVSAQLPPLRDGESEGIVVVMNESENPIRDCRVSLSDYSASNGYLTGATPFFGMDPGVSDHIAMSVTAQNPIPGTYQIRLSLECENRLKHKVHTEIAVE